MDDNILKKLAFWPKFRPQVFLKLIKKYKTLDKVLGKNIAELSKFVPQIYIQEMLDFTRSREFKNAFNILNKYKIKAITYLNKTYPENLREISSFPLVLFYKGKLEIPQNTIGIVGTRKMSVYGKQACEKIIPELVDAGFSTISGLALGIDSQVARSTLESGGKTFAVLGNGLPNIYPAYNQKIAIQIIKTGGAIISEFPPFYPSFKQNFPQRNRVISGLSSGLLVVEAAESSGSLITASFALEQNKQVYAIPGSIFSNQSKGTNKLIKLGAKPVLSSEDILEDFGIEKGAQVLEKDLNFDNLEQETVYNLTDPEKAITINQLSLLLKKDISEVSAHITSLELKGLIKNIGMGKYIRN